MHRILFSCLGWCPWLLLGDEQETYIQDYCFLTCYLSWTQRLPGFITKSTKEQGIETDSGQIILVDYFCQPGHFIFSSHIDINSQVAYYILWNMQSTLTLKSQNIEITVFLSLIFLEYCNTKFCKSEFWRKR